MAIKFINLAQDEAPPPTELVINELDEKTTPADGDITVIEDSADTFIKKKFSWANIKTAIKSYYDSVVSTLTNKTISGSSNTLSNIAQASVTNLVSDLSTISGTIVTMLSSIADKIAGSTGSTDNSILRADGTGGKTAQGGSLCAIDDTGKMTIGTAATHTYELNIRKDQTTGTSFEVRNNSTAGGAFAAFFLKTTQPAKGCYFYHFSTGYATSGRYVQDSSLLDGANPGGLGISASDAAGVIRFWTGGNNERMRINSAGSLGIGLTTITAYLHIKAGTTAASTAPLKFTSGALMITAEAGAIEFLTDKGYLTITTGEARKEITLNDIPLTSGRIPFATTNGRLTDNNTFIYSGGSVGIGGTPNANAILDLQSTTKAFMPPRMTTTQRDAIASPTTGMMVYNTTTDTIDYYSASAGAWVSL